MSKLKEEAANTRDLAKRARRLARGLTASEDIERLKRYADELDAKALEERALRDD